MKPKGCISATTTTKIVTAATVFLCLFVTLSSSASATTTSAQAELAKNLTDFMGNVTLLSVRFKQFNESISREISSEQQTNNKTEKDNLSYMLLELLNVQTEILARNQAIRAFVVSKLNKLFQDEYSDTSESLEQLVENRDEIRDKLLSVLLARAQVRAQLSILQASESLWQAWAQLIELFGGQRRQQILQIIDVIRESKLTSLMMEPAMYGSQYEAYKAYYELSKPAKSSREVFAELDTKLDIYFDCVQVCPSLIVHKYSNAAPVGPVGLVTAWTKEYIDRGLMEAIESSRQLVRERFHITHPHDLHLDGMDKINSFRVNYLEGNPTRLSKAGD